MFNSRVFKFRYLVALILLVVLVAAVGNAAALTVNDANQNVVAGSAGYTPETATVTYAINGSGDVIATVTLANPYDAVSASIDGGTTYSGCVGGGVTWTCTLPNASLAAAASLDLVATRDN